MSVNPSPSKKQPCNDFADHPLQVISELARLIMPQAIHLLTLPTDSPADPYRRELGQLIAPSLRLWVAMTKQTDPIDLFSLHLAADDAADTLTTLLDSEQFLADVFTALTGQDATVPELAWQIKTKHRPVEELQHEITGSLAGATLMPGGDRPFNATYFASTLCLIFDTISLWIYSFPGQPVLNNI